MYIAQAYPDNPPSQKTTSAIKIFSLDTNDPGKGLIWSKFFKFVKKVKAKLAKSGSMSIICFSSSFNVVILHTLDIRTFAEKVVGPIIIPKRSNSWAVTRDMVSHVMHPIVKSSFFRGGPKVLPRDLPCKQRYIFGKNAIVSKGTVPKKKC